MVCFWTRGRRMVDADETTEQWRPPFSQCCKTVFEVFLFATNGQGPSNYLSCCFSSSCSSGHSVNLLLGCISGVHFWFKSGHRPRTSPGLVLLGHPRPLHRLFPVSSRMYQELVWLWGQVTRGLGWFHSKKWTWTNWSLFNRFTWFINCYPFHGLLCRLWFELATSLRQISSHNHWTTFLTYY